MKTSLKNIEWVRSVSAVEGECWIWQRYKIRDGYGRLTRQNRQVLAHRWSALIHEQITQEQFEDPVIVIRHLCDRPACINPKHLLVGTQQDNIRDRTTRGRTAKHLNRRDKLGRFK